MGSAARKPLNFPPRGLDRMEAAGYIGVSPNTFDKLVAEGKMPKPRRPVDRRVVWDRYALDEAFDQLPQDGEAENAWDKALG